MSRVIAILVGAALWSSVAAAQMVIIERQGPGPGGIQAPARDAQQKTGTAVIRGRVFGADTGAPLRRAQVRASSQDTRESRATSTDAQGRFELKELPAGRYVVTASKGSYVMLQYGQTRPNEPGKPIEIAEGQVVERIEFKLPRGGIVTGRVLDEFGEPLSDAQVMAMRYAYFNGRRQLVPAGRFAQTNDIGEYRLFGLPPGQYYVTVNMRMGGFMTADSDDRSGYAPTYYPGTSNVAEAQRLTLAVGQELASINVALSPTRTARVTGTAVDSAGRPMANAFVQLVQTHGGGFFMGTSAGQVRPDGSFALSNVPPGEYTIQATSGGPMGGGDGEFASAPVTIAGEDVNGVRLIATAPGVMTGQVVVDGGVQPTFGPTAVQLRAQPASPDGMLMMAMGSRVNDDWSFEIKSRPGPTLLRPLILPAGWSLKAILQNGADVTDTPLDVGGNGEVRGLQVVLTNRATELSGVVTDARMQPVKEYAVVVFAEDREKWGFLSRYLATGRPDQDGRFKIRALPPGEYLAVAIDYIEQGESSDPEFLEKVRPKATRFSLGEGETRTMDLRLTPES